MSHRDDTINEIARRVLLLSTLETRGRDALDFHDLAVWAVREALGRAYDAGREAGPPELVAPEHACPVCGERRADRLEWLNDEDDQARCVCGMVYAAPSHPANRPEGDA